MEWGRGDSEDKRSEIGDQRSVTFAEASAFAKATADRSVFAKAMADGSVFVETLKCQFGGACDRRQ